MFNDLINEMLKKIMTVLVVAVVLTGSYGFYLHVTETKNLQLNNKFYSDYKTRKNELPKYDPSGEFSIPIAASAPAVARLEKDGVFRCTAFIISNDYAITAAHCLVSNFSKKLDTNDIEIVSEDRTISVTAQAVGSYSSGDLGLIRGEFQNFKKLSIDASVLSVPRALTATQLVSCGYPRGTNRIVCYRQSQCGVYYDFVACQGLLYHGMSGGPLISIDEVGSVGVVGVNSALASDSNLFSPLIGLFELFNIKTKD